MPSPDALAQILATWDGTEASAQTLRRALAEAAGSRAFDGAAGDPGASLYQAYRQRRPELLARCAPGDAAPFVGDPAIGPWPFDDPLSLADEEAALWLPLVAHAAIVSDSIRALVRTMFRTRRRDTWIPASRALARLALRDEALRTELLALWREYFPDGLPGAWPAVGFSAREPRPNVHLSRHVLYAGCAYAAAGGTGVQPHLAEALLRISPPVDATDASVLVLALEAFLDDPAASGVIGFTFQDLVRRLPASPLIDASLRAVWARVPAGPPRAAVIAHLIVPAWKRAHADGAIDLLSSWLDSAAFLRDHAEWEGLEAMRKDAGEALDLIALRLDSEPARPGRLAGELLDCLRIVLDDTCWFTTPDGDRVLALTRALLLVQRPELQDLEWPYLVRRVIGRDPDLKLPAGVPFAENAIAGLAVCLAGRDNNPAVLLRDRRFHEQVVVHLAASPNGFIARQVAVQLECRLRGRPPEEQVRLIWAVLRRDPPQELFRQLLGVLRSADTPLHGLIEAARRADAARLDDPVVLAAWYQQLVDAVGEVMKSDGGGPRSRAARPSRTSSRAKADLLCVAPDAALQALRSVAATLTDLADPEPANRFCVPLTSAWFDRIDILLLGREDAPGLLHWFRFLGMTDGLIEREDDRPVRNALRQWRSATEAFVGSAGVVAPEELPGLERASEGLVPQEDALTAAFSRTAWPERQLVATLIHRARGRREEIVRAARSAARAAERLRDLLAGADEGATMAALQDPGFVADLPLASVRQAYGYLVDRHRYHDARRFRRCIRDRVRLPAVPAMLWPLFAAVPAGTLLVLDVGTAWNVTLDGRPTAYWFTIGAAHLVSFSLLIVSLAARAGDAGRGASIIRRLLRFAVRVSKLYFSVVIIALVVSSVVLLTLRGSDVVVEGAFLRQTLLWSSLSLFLGLFLGLILQGRGVMQRDL